VPFSVTRHRLQGYADAVDDWARVPVVVLTRNDRAEAETAARELLMTSTVDAIAAMSDELALGVREAAQRLGISVPARLSITGWDDSPAAAAADLTTIAQSLREQGELCARAVIEPDVPTPPQAWRLVTRGSTR
jgi:DNA-binding LacI/PurR family transcriptional regulator